VLRIPYREWRLDPASQVGRVLDALHGLSTNDHGDSPSEPRTGSSSAARAPSSPKKAHPVSQYQSAIVEAVRAGSRDEENVLRAALTHLGRQRLGPRIRERLVLAAREVSQMGLIVIEDNEYFMTPEGRSAELRIKARVKSPRSRSIYSQRSSRSSYRRRGDRHRGYRRY